MATKGHEFYSTIGPYQVMALGRLFTHADSRSHVGLNPVSAQWAVVLPYVSAFCSSDFVVRLVRMSKVGLYLNKILQFLGGPSPRSPTRASLLHCTGDLCPTDPFFLPEPHPRSAPITGHAASADVCLEL